MKQYVISEEELDYLKDCMKDDSSAISAGNDLIEEIKSKQPVEEIARGEVTVDEEDGETWVGDPDINGTPIACELGKLEGKNIKVFIQEEK